MSYPQVASNPVQNTTISQSISNLQDHKQAICRITARVMALSEQIIGPAPTKLGDPTTGMIDTPPSSNLFHSVEDVGKAIAVLEMVLERFYNP